MADVGRVDLQRHGVADLAGDQHRLVAAARQQRLRDGHVKGRQQRLRFHFGQHLAALGQHAFDQQARAFHVGRCAGRQRRRRLLQELLVLIKAGDVAKGADGRLGRAKARNLRLGQGVARRLHRRITHPASHQRFAHARLDLHQLARHGLGIAAELGRIDDQHAIELLVLGGDVERGLVVLWRGVFGQVDQIGQRRGLGHQLRQRAGVLVGQHAQLQRQLVHVIGRQHAGAAAVGDDAQAPADRAVARGQALGGREQLDEGAHAHRAGAAQHGAPHLVAADDGARVRLRGHVAVLLAAGLQHHYRLAVGRRAQRAGKAPRVGNAFHVDHDALRAPVVGQKIQHVGQPDLRVRAQRHHGRKADVVLPRPVEDRRRERARLRHQRQLPGRRQRAGRTGVELQIGPLQALTVRPQQPHAVALRHAVHLLRLGRADAGRQHQRRFNLDAPGQLQCGHDFVLGQRDDGQIGARLRQIGQRAGGVNVQRRHPPLERLLRHVRQQRARLRRLLLGRALRAGEEQDRLRLEQGGEVVLVHGDSSAGQRGR